jgi:hypothetical protein
MATRRLALILNVAVAASAGTLAVALSSSVSCSYPTRVFVFDDGGSGDDGATASDAGSGSDAPQGLDAPAATDGPPCSALASQTAPYTPTMFGCRDFEHDAAAVGTTWADRANLCGGSWCRVCTAQDWIDYQMPPVSDASSPDAVAPTAAQPLANYWVDDNLLPSGAIPGACAAVSADSGLGSNNCTGQPMRVCVHTPSSAAITDKSGDTCTLHDCGFGTQMPDLYFGGCVPSSDMSAGTLCCCYQ